MRHGLLLVLALVGSIGPGRIASADGTGVLIQRQGDRLAIGFDTGAATSDSTGLGALAFGGVVASDGLTQEPSFLSLAIPPTGSEQLPIGQNVYWDFVPLTHGGVTSNLMRWEGAGEFDLTPVEDATVTLYDPTFNGATVAGEAAAVPGLRLGTTSESSPLTLHAHRLWYLIGESDGSAPEGVYITALRVWMDGLTPSDPFFVALGTPGMSDAVNNDAIPWIESNSDDLILRGDYNFDGLVDSADYALWGDQFGAIAPQPVEIGEADGNGDGRIDAADYTMWRDQLDSESAVEAFAVPEPGGLAFSLAAIWAFIPACLRSRVTHLAGNTQPLPRPSVIQRPSPLPNLTRFAGRGSAL